MRERRPSLVFTCEHASHRIPARHRAVAARAGAVLHTHRGFDPGTAELGRLLSRRFGAPLFLGKWSRLLIELNRSPHHPHLWSEYSKALPACAKRDLFEQYHRAHWQAVQSAIRRMTGKGGTAVHIGVHSFTPVWKGDRRRADIGLLYDPGRGKEAAFCARWQRALVRQAPNLRVRMNYPYRGTADGLTTQLRKLFAGSRYLGIEIEINQRFPLGSRADWIKTMALIASSLDEVLA
jgi:predicted N-formylglutamate amidohydrolase